MERAHVVGSYAQGLLELELYYEADVVPEKISF
jgi:hypothetical protein